MPQAEGFGKNQRCNISALSTSQESRFAADGQPLRLASSPLPLYRRRRGDTEEDIAVFQILSYGAQLHQHRIICYIAAGAATQGEDIAGSGL